MLRDEEEKARVEQQLAQLTERLQGLTCELQGKHQARAEYDRTIRETEAAYAKIVESSETLLRVLRREATHLASSSSSASSASLSSSQQQQQQGQQPAKAVAGQVSTPSSSSLSSLVNGMAAAMAVTGAGNARRAGGE